MKVLETERLILRRMTGEDAGFILGLLNEPSWLRFIGDRGVRTIEGARDYIARGPAASYERHGFGLYLTELKESGVPAGICGLIKRETLEDVDLGFAFVPKFWGQGLARESAAAVLEYARGPLGLKRVAAVTAVDNHASIRLLEKLGFRFERMVRLSEGDEEIKLFARDL
ncbi:MAG TPA: GNAT family N-acetyltransferase [Pyrinomonadaceae bacterium]|nr:GNAT family N-acetyltransferase [Pyrinomonadaceae bacterium]